MIVEIDADPIVYRAGFAGESVEYHVIAEDAEGNLHEHHFAAVVGESAREQRDKWLLEHKLTLLSEDKTIIPEPVENVLQIVKMNITGILDAIAEKFKEEVTPRLVLSGPGNYREKLATLKPYKGNRDPEHKPFHYQAIRDYLTGLWGAYVVHGREADDEISIRAAEHARKKERYVVASIDKDLEQIKGWHYDYRQHVFVHLSKDDADRMFWIQVLAGDPTDNIGGACGIGVVKADKMLQEWDRLYESLPAAKRDKLIWERIVSVYEQQRSRPNCYYADKGAEEAALENARLVYLQRKPNELWNPPGVRNGQLEGNLDD